MEKVEVNDLKEIQKMLMTQMKRLDTAVAGEVRIETARSGALSQNASAYVKSVQISLKVKEMVSKNPQAETTILREIGVLNDEQDI